MRIRLDRWLTALALASRSEGKGLIRRGAVTVNGRTVLDPGAVFETEEAHLALGGRPIDGRTERHVMMNKPSGLLTAARDRKQPTVMDLLPPAYASLGCMPAGRLDKDTTGILFLTTDGELNHRLLSPGRHVDKVYRARVSGRLTEADVRAFAAGLALSDFTAMPAELRILEAGDAESLGEVTVSEGKFHQVKRMFAATGHEVLALRRERFGPLEMDGTLAEGQWRELKDAERDALYAVAGLERRREETSHE